MSKPKDYFISFEDACHALGILKSDFQHWVKEDNPEIGKDYMDRKAIKKSYLETCAFKDDYYVKIEKSFRVENEEIKRETESKKQFYQKECTNLLTLYATFIEDLVKIHQKYKNIVEQHGPESKVLAAYLLFAKAISILSCLCENLKLGYWYVGSMLREIDETLDVAFYFIISGNENSEPSDLIKWFRLGRSPSHNKCRIKIAEWYSQLAPLINQENHRLLMSNLYGIKSQFIHPTFQSIRDSSILAYTNGKMSIDKLCYGKTSRTKRLWELTHFTKSSIWTCFQQFMMIFIDSMPLTQKDIDFLLEYDHKFKKLDSDLEW